LYKEIKETMIIKTNEKIKLIFKLKGILRKTEIKTEIKQKKPTILKYFLPETSSSLVIHERNHPRGKASISIITETKISIITYLKPACF
jgi:hypothetical protein